MGNRRYYWHQLSGSQDAAQHPTKHRAVYLHPPPPPQKIVSAQNISSVEIEKPWLTDRNALGQGVVVVLEQKSSIADMCPNFREVWISRPSG